MDTRGILCIYSSSLCDPSVLDKDNQGVGSQKTTPLCWKLVEKRKESINNTINFEEQYPCIDHCYPRSSKVADRYVY